MAFAVLRQELTGRIEVGVSADASEDVEHFPTVRLRVLNPIGSQDRQSIMRRKIDKFAVNPFFATNEMPLEFDEHIFAPESVNKELRAIRGSLGSARVSRAGFGVPPKRSSKSSRRRDVVTSMRDACATQ